MNMSVKKTDLMHDRLQTLTNSDRRECLRLWRETFDVPPAKYLSQQFMQKAIAYELQLGTFGGMSKSTKRVLGAAAKGKKAASLPVKTISPGTRLLREWNGRTYEVEVSNSGFVWQGKRYRSLSAIAREITGTRWSGPRFFGVAVP